mmetsp:Transcript_5733/g.7409  ORF Transcript_5733/g.7409 Transcript_5733/m.7409 type:complete len:330 (-) Transcript_5733:347-1336(-)
MPFRDIATSDSIYLVPGTATSLDAKQIRTLDRLAQAGLGIIVPQSDAAALTNDKKIKSSHVFTTVNIQNYLDAPSKQKIVVIQGDESDDQIQTFLEHNEQIPCVFIDIDISQLSRLHASRRFVHLAKEASFPIIHKLTYNTETAKTPGINLLRKDLFILKLGMDGGSLLVDALGDGVLVDAPFDIDFLRSASFGLLQGSRMRNVKTEFVSCPSCGRTLFDLQEVTQMISERTGHLPGVTIAIMGCIVNGPGEMADADFGYVGGAPGKVDLYVGKEVVKRGIPNEIACDALVDLIKEYDRWTDPPADDDDQSAAQGEDGKQVSQNNAVVA